MCIDLGDIEEMAALYSTVLLVLSTVWNRLNVTLMTQGLVTLLSL